MADDRIVERTTQHAFDSAAPVYDAQYEELYGIKRLRRIIHACYLRHFRPGQRLLELNCGTGTDAIVLAQNRMHVLATDLSPAMIAEAQKKVEAARVVESVELRVLSYLDLGSLRGEKFDGAYSNMGGINCTNDLGIVAAHLGSLIQPGGFFIATVLTNFCLWETLAFLGRGKLRQAFRRRKKAGVAAHLHGGRVQTYYFSPRAFASAFANWFDVVSIAGLNIFTPPPNSPRAYSLVPKLMRLLERLDDSVAHISPFSAIGDHFLIVLRRR
jgi:SAM-dependent methyltransferase